MGNSESNENELNSKAPFSARPPLDSLRLPTALSLGSTKRNLNVNKDVLISPCSSREVLSRSQSLTLCPDRQIQIRTENKAEALQYVNQSRLPANQADTSCTHFFQKQRPREDYSDLSNESFMLQLKSGDIGSHDFSEAGTRATGPIDADESLIDLSLICPFKCDRTAGFREIGNREDGSGKTGAIAI